MSADKHQCDRYSLVGLPGVEFCRKGGARAVHERLEELRAQVADTQRQLIDGRKLVEKVIAERDGLHTELDRANNRTAAVLNERDAYRHARDHAEKQNAESAAHAIEAWKERDQLATECAQLREALQKVDEIACRAEPTSGYGENPPEPVNPDGEELAYLARAALTPGASGAWLADLKNKWRTEWESEP